MSRANSFSMRSRRERRVSALTRCSLRMPLRRRWYGTPLSQIPGTPCSFPLPCRRFPPSGDVVRDAGRDARHGFSSPPRPLRKSVWCPWNTERVRLHRPTSNPPYQVASAWSWTPSARATLRTVASVCNQRRVAVCRESEWRDAGRSTLDRSVMRLAVQLDELVEEAIAPQRTRPGTGSPHQTRL